MKASVLSGFTLFLFVISAAAENTKQILPETVVTVRTDYNVAVFYRMLTQKVIVIYVMSCHVIISSIYIAIGCHSVSCSGGGGGC